MDMLEYGTFDQPSGTWSDDSSLAFCLAESLCDGYNIQDIAIRFIKWFDEGYWTAHEEVFDIGNATLHAINKLKKGVNPKESGGKKEGDNGNGSLMRILPLAFHLLNTYDINERYEKVNNVSSITHAHLRSIMACFFYIELAIILIYGRDFSEAIEETISLFVKLFNGSPQCINFERILNKEIFRAPEREICSGGYVIHSLEASLWCIYNSKSYEESVLMAVNLGADTDTTAAITGGLAGIIYGYESIPSRWVENIARKNDIFELCKKLHDRCVMNFPQG